MELIPLPYGHPDVVALTQEVQAHYRRLYGGPGDQSPVDVADFEAPTGHFVVGYLDGVPAAMGGWRRLGDRPGLPSPNTAEIKRMYVAPAARRLGLSRVVLAELEASARQSADRSTDRVCRTDLVSLLFALLPLLVSFSVLHFV